MADEAFALSPISARATLPSEEDYDAISQAFMETSRGRWFLGEYAKRNRNADTRMVLDAVARIEDSIAAQRQPPPDNRLPEALAVIKAAVDEARTAADVAIDGLGLEQHLAPVRKGARVIREIVWRLREIGADGRIYDLIDSQVSAIEAGCGQISSTDPKTALSGVFDLIEGRIAGFDDGDSAPSPAAEAATPAASAPPPDEASAAATAPMQVEIASATDDVEAAASLSALPVEQAVANAEVTEAAADAEETTVAATDLTADATDMVAESVDMEVADMEVLEATAEAADAHDEAVLDMIALEMAAPDPFDDVYDGEADEIHAGELAAAGPPMVMHAAEPLMSEPEAAPRPPPSLQLPPQPFIQPSLGSSLIESGIVRPPVPSLYDPLAPIRRMSQAEKIAFFS